MRDFHNFLSVKCLFYLAHESKIAKIIKMFTFLIKSIIRILIIGNKRGITRIAFNRLRNAKIRFFHLKLLHLLLLLHLPFLLLSLSFLFQLVWLISQINCWDCIKSRRGRHFTVLLGFYLLFLVR